MSDRTEISSLGEFGLIDHLTKNFELRNASTIVGVGDDAAVIDHFGRQTVVTTDLLIEGVHFDLMYTPLKHLGYKSIVVNLSDVYAMNATPTQVTVSIGISNRFSLEALNEFYEGIYAACEKYNVDLAGGDTSSSQKGFIISVTAIGEVAPNKFVKRSTANKDDLICVSGDLGAAFLGLTLMEREKRIYLENPQIQPDLEGEDYIVGRLLKPEAKATLTKVLTCHVVGAKAMSDAVMKMVKDDGGAHKVKTVGGCELTLKLDGDKVTVTDETGGVANVTIADVEQSNGVIHVIDKVLLPKM